MDDKTVEQIFALGVQVGVINLASEMGLINENMSEKQAYAKYGERQVKDWRSKRWVVGYPTGNKTRSKVYYKRSELDTASRMISIQNMIPATKIKQIIQM
jgi:hypothetical protein